MVLLVVVGGRSCGYFARAAIGKFEVNGEETVPFEAVTSQYGDN